jgi:hypothetical protein
MRGVGGSGPALLGKRPGGRQAARISAAHRLAGDLAASRASLATRARALSHPPGRWPAGMATLGERVAQPRSGHPLCTQSVTLCVLTYA